MFVDRQIFKYRNVENSKQQQISTTVMLWLTNYPIFTTLFFLPSISNINDDNFWDFHFPSFFRYCSRYQNEPNGPRTSLV